MAVLLLHSVASPQLKSSFEPPARQLVKEALAKAQQQQGMSRPLPQEEEMDPWSFSEEEEGEVEEEEEEEQCYMGFKRGRARNGKRRALRNGDGEALVAGGRAGAPWGAEGRVSLGVGHKKGKVHRGEGRGV